MGQNALVDISTSKEYLSYNGNLTLKVLENGLFKYRAISGTSHSTQTAALKDVGTIAMEFSQDSIGHFTTDKNGFSGPNPTISVNSPNYILFDASSSNKAVLSGLVPKFVRKDTDGNNYPINYLTKTGQAELTPIVTPSQTVSVSNANIKSGYSVAIHVLLESCNSVVFQKLALMSAKLARRSPNGHRKIWEQVLKLAIN